MRTIKFRGQQVHDNDWFEGSLISLENGKSYITQDLRTPQERNQKTGYTLAHFSEVIPETVGQFTGLKDKNGKEIYEGDILKFEAESPYPFAIMNNGVVKYEPCKFYLDDGVNQIGIHVDNWYELEVIGNIHDNPELSK